MPDWSDTELDQIATIVAQEISRVSPSAVERRMTTTGGTTRPDNLDLDLSTFIDNVSRVRGVRRLEYAYGQPTRQYRGYDWKTDTIITMRISSCPTTGTAITAFADAGSGEVTVTCAAHGLSTNDVVTIVGTTSYNGTFVVTKVDANSFKITDTWVADDATGNIGELVGMMLEEDHTVGETASSNTMNPTQEGVFKQGMVAHAWVHWLEQSRDEINNAISAISTANTSIGNVSARVTQAVADLASGNTQADKVSAIVDKAATEIGLMNTEVDLAKNSLATGKALINTNTITGQPAMEYVSQAGGEVGTAQGYLSVAQGYIAQAREDESIAGTYARQAAGQLQSAGTYLSQASGYMSEINARLAASTKMIQLSQGEAMRKMRDYERALMNLGFEYNKKMSYTNRAYARG